MSTLSWALTQDNGETPKSKEKPIGKVPSLAGFSHNGFLCFASLKHLELPLDFIQGDLD